MKFQVCAFWRRTPQWRYDKCYSERNRNGDRFNQLETTIFDYVLSLRKRVIDIFLAKERIELIVINLEELILVIFHVVGSELYKRDCTPCAVMEIISTLNCWEEMRQRDISTVAPTWKCVSYSFQFYFALTKLKKYLSFARSSINLWFCQLFQELCPLSIAPWSCYKRFV